MFDCIDCDKINWYLSQLRLAHQSHHVHETNTAREMDISPENWLPRAITRKSVARKRAAIGVAQVLAHIHTIRCHNI